MTGIAVIWTRISSSTSSAARTTSSRALAIALAPVGAVKGTAGAIPRIRCELIEFIIDGKPVGRTRLEKTIPLKFSSEGGAAGHDTGTPLVDDYRIDAAIGASAFMTDSCTPL